MSCLRKEQQIERILKCNNFYEILEVPNNATNKEIKLAYNKLAVIVHPDKNKFSGSNEAFIALNQAMAVLMNDEKRREYDVYLRGPTPFGLEQFKLPESSVNNILIATGVIATAITLTTLFTSLWKTRRDQH